MPTKIVLVPDNNDLGVVITIRHMHVMTLTLLDLSDKGRGHHPHQCAVI